MKRQEKLEERTNNVLEYLQQNKSVEKEKIARDLKIPLTSLQRILLKLHDRKMVKKVYVKRKRPSIRNRVFWEIVE